MSISLRMEERQSLVSRLAETLLFGEDNKPLSSVAILRHAQALAGSLIVEIEHPDENGCRFGNSSADRLVVSALKEISQFAQTPEESIVLKKTVLEVLVDNSVAEYELVYLHQRNKQ